MTASTSVRCGMHVSIAGSIDRAVDRAVEKECDTFQIFTRNPRGWQSKGLVPEDVSMFREKLGKSEIRPAIAHMPYLPNLSCPDQPVYKKSVDTLISDLERCAALGIPYLVTHLGSHRGKGRTIGLKCLTDAINTAFVSFRGSTVLLLENTAGTENSMGTTFEDVRDILDGVTDKLRVAVCFDTCHAFAAGYDLRNAEKVNVTLAQLDHAVGSGRVKVVHANDSVGELGSHLDRHEHIGMGHIGEAGFRAILHSDVLRLLPFILETPIDERRSDEGNLRQLRKLAA